MKDKSNQRPISHWISAQVLSERASLFISWILAAGFGKLKNRWWKENLLPHKHMHGHTLTGVMARKLSYSNFSHL